MYGQCMDYKLCGVTLFKQSSIVVYSSPDKTILNRCVQNEGNQGGPHRYEISFPASCSFITLTDVFLATKLYFCFGFSPVKTTNMSFTKKQCYLFISLKKISTLNTSKAHLQVKN